ncbi:thiamine-phosphate kinase, partial [Melaminivora alkalimesophila]
ALGQALAGCASSAIDVSDGLLGDLGHILRASGVGARVEADAAAALIGGCEPLAGLAEALGQELLLRCVLSGGDDYELLFTAEAQARSAVQSAARACGVPVTRIGRIEAQPGLRLVDAQGAAVEGRFPGFDHFA